MNLSASTKYPGSLRCRHATGRAAVEAALVDALAARSGLPLWRCLGHLQDITTVAFHPDGKHLLAASKDGTISIWSVTW